MPLITLTIKPLFFSTTPSFFHFHPSFLFEIKPISYLTAFPFYLCRFVKIFPLDLFLKLSKVVLYSTFRTLLFEVYRHCYNEHLLSVMKGETEEQILIFGWAQLSPSIRYISQALLKLDLVIKFWPMKCE